MVIDNLSTAFPSKDSKPMGASRPGSTLVVVMAWIVVGFPLAWGVTRTVINSLELFRSPHVQNVQNSTSGASTSVQPANPSAGH